MRKIQNELFDIGAILCMPGKKKNAKLINEAIVFLEKDIDKMNSKLSNLKSFILPGGSKSSSFTFGKNNNEEV